MSGSLSYCRWHRVTPLTTTAAQGRVKSTSHGASYTMAASLVRSLSLPTLSDESSDCPKHQAGTQIRALPLQCPVHSLPPSLPHPPISRALPLRPTGLRRFSLQETSKAAIATSPRRFIQGEDTRLILSPKIGVSCLFFFDRKQPKACIFIYLVRIKQNIGAATVNNSRREQLCA